MAVKAMFGYMRRVCHAGEGHIDIKHLSLEAWELKVGGWRLDVDQGCAAGNVTGFRLLMASSSLHSLLSNRVHDCNHRSLWPIYASISKCRCQRLGTYAPTVVDLDPILPPSA